MPGQIIKSGTGYQLTTGTSTPNLIAGDPFEIAVENSLVSMGFVASALGTFATVTVGGRLVAAEHAIPIGVSTTAPFPVIPDSMFYNFIQLAGERLAVPWRNPTGGTVIPGLLAQIASAGR